MASDLLSIAASGARAARGALDVTAQNIANAASDGYVRRTARMEEMSAAGGMLRMGDMSLSGVRISAVHRNADMFHQAEVRRSTADSSRGAAELAGLQNIETAIDQSGLYTSIVEFEAALQQLTSDPVDLSLRAEVMSNAQAMANKFNIAAGSLTAAGEGLRFNAQAGVDQVNVIAPELARINLRLTRAGADSSDRATLLDQRDMLLERLSGLTSITTTFAQDGQVTVDLGGGVTPSLVAGGTAQTISMTTAADGTVSYQSGTTTFIPSGGSLAGNAAALASAASAMTTLDTLANTFAAAMNAAQGNGAALDGATGTAMFAGTGAAGLAVAFTDGALIATAPAGAGAGSRNTAGLDGLRQAVDTSGLATGVNALLFDVSSQVSGRKITQDALDAITASSRVALEEQSGVDLDTEAANLIRFQQAFQASGRAMQVATDVFDTLLGIG